MSPFGEFLANETAVVLLRLIKLAKPRLSLLSLSLSVSLCLSLSLSLYLSVSLLSSPFCLSLCFSPFLSPPSLPSVFPWSYFMKTSFFNTHLLSHVYTYIVNRSPRSLTTNLSSNHQFLLSILIHVPILFSVYEMVS